MKVRLSERADGEMNRIDAWWRQNRREAPELFLDELNEATRILADSPSVGTPFGSVENTLVRRLLLRGARHHVYYVVDDEGVLVLAIWGAQKEKPPRLR